MRNKDVTKTTCIDEVKEIIEVQGNNYSYRNITKILVEMELISTGSDSIPLYIVTVEEIPIRISKELG